MKETRFIELLNLYVDQHLSEADASELEAEILRNPRRRRTYQQYCRMQKACTRLFEYERVQAPSSPALSRALADADRKIVAFPDGTETWMRGSYVAGFAAVAVAACLAFALVRNNRPVLPASTDLVSNASTAPTSIVSQPVTIPTIARNVENATAHPQFYSVLATRKLLSSRDTALNDTVEENQQNQPTFDWMKKLELAPLRKVTVEDLAFELRPTLKSDSHVFHGQHPFEAQAEPAAFQFQR